MLLITQTIYFVYNSGLSQTLGMIPQSLASHSGCSRGGEQEGQPSPPLPPIILMDGQCPSNKVEEES